MALEEALDELISRDIRDTSPAAFRNRDMSRPPADQDSLEEERGCVCMCVREERLTVECTAREKQTKMSEIIINH